MSVFAQGDLVFIPVAAIPKKAKRAPDLTLALGEATGHSHRAVGPQVNRFLADEGGGGSYLLVKGKPADVVHEEHDTITLAPGCWEVRRQMEFPATSRSRMVAD